MIAKRVGRGLGAIALGGILSLAACGPGEERGGLELATVSLAITQAPADVSCIRVAAAGTKTVNAAFAVATGQGTVFEMGGLPTGTVSFRAEAFPGPCAGPAADATWVSDVVTTSLKPGKNPGVTLTMRARATLSVAVDFPGIGGDAKWTSFDGSPAGTPAQVTINTALSGPEATVFDLALHGLYLEPKTGPDGKAYQRLVIPGLASLEQEGAPQLPALRAILGVVNGGAVLAGEAAVGQVTVLDGVLPWPQPLVELDQAAGPGGGAPGSRPEQFRIDEAIYSGRLAFPASDAAVVSPRQQMVAGLEGAVVELHPVRFDPASGKISVATQVRFSFSHRGTAQAPEIFREQADEAAATFANWAVIAKSIGVLQLFAGQFLFVYPPTVAAEIAPLVAQKKARGFTVTELTTNATGNTCASIRAAIKGWYDASPKGDHYAILVGDTGRVPLCTAPTGSPTDDLYGSTNGDDLNEEVMVGRLSIVDGTDLAAQVQKILAYEDAPDTTFNYGRALLVAHAQGAPGKYVGAQEAVRTASYAVPPSFSTLYGNVPGVTNADVVDAINEGQGVVAYRGHGSETEWWSWNLTNQSFTSADLMTVANPPVRTPVVWSFACSNAALDSSPSISEFWMRTSNWMGVAHYGATVPSATDANHVLDAKMFEAVYDKGLTTHAKAIRWAEKQMTLALPGSGTGNAWMYLLLGDPEMRIRRRPVHALPRLEAPAAIGECHVVCDPLRVRVTDPSGKPVAGALVIAHQPPAPEPGPVADASGYTNADGVVDLPIGDAAPGALRLTARAGGDDLAVGVVPVRAR